MNDDLDGGAYWPADSNIPDVRDLPADFWGRKVRDAQIEGERL